MRWRRLLQQMWEAWTGSVPLLPGPVAVVTAPERFAAERRLFARHGRLWDPYTVKATDQLMDEIIETLLRLEDDAAERERVATDDHGRLVAVEQRVGKLWDELPREIVSLEAQLDAIEAREVARQRREHKEPGRGDE